MRTHARMQRAQDALERPTYSSGPRRRDLLWVRLSPTSPQGSSRLALRRAFSRRPRLAAVDFGVRPARIRRPVFLPERRQARGADDLLETGMAPQECRLRHPQDAQRNRLAIALQARHAIENEFGAAQCRSAQDL